MRIEDILSMSRKEVLALNTLDVPDASVLTAEAILHIFKVLDASWFYDYEAAKVGRAGLHAELKSGRHSDGFLNFREAGQHHNIRYLMAMALAKRFLSIKGVSRPDFVAGIPEAATGLGEDFGDALCIPVARMFKEEGTKSIRIADGLGRMGTLLLVEDICTKATGFSEAVRNIKQNYPEVFIVPFELVIFNRGGLQTFAVDLGHHNLMFSVVSLAERRINDWSPEECPLCREFGSKVIKPKDKDHPENWSLLANSQSAE